MSKTNIPWTEKTINVVVGCTPITTGCKNCYAKRMFKRLQAMKLQKYDCSWGDVHLDMHGWESKMIKKPTMYFVNSMSDTFHEKLPFSDIEKIIAAITTYPQHTFQILTKRASRMAAFFKNRIVPENLWLGVTVENKFGIPRMDYLRKIKTSSVRFISFEPLLEDVSDLHWEGIHWAIVGGESGPKARPIKKEWIVNIQSQCTHTAFYFKQWGGTRPSKNGYVLNGKICRDYPNLDKV